jgi:hypothetical protein
MKSFQQIVLFLVASLACGSAFAPVNSPRQSMKALSMSDNSKSPVEFKIEDEKKAAAFAAFTTALSPFAAHADAVDESVVIGYGAGLVACVVSLAVGFAIGYGTLVKL